MTCQECSLVRLRIVAEADPGALARVLERFQNLNIVPRKLIADSGASGLLYIEVHIAGVSESMAALIVAKLGQVPCILNAYRDYV